MNRGLGLVLGLAVIGCALFAGWFSSVRTPYFDPNVFDKPYPCATGRQAPEKIPTDVDAWWSGPLRAVGEPSLFQSPPTNGQTIIRLTFLPSFVEPVVVRIDDLYGDRPLLTAHRVVGQVHPKPGTNYLKRTLSAEESQSVRRFLDASDVLALEPDGCYTGVDGVIYLIEANGPDGYRLINRWDVYYGPVYELANLLFDLTGWPNGDQGPDRPLNPNAPAFVLTGTGRFAVFGDVMSIRRDGDAVRMRALQVVEEDFVVDGTPFWGDLSSWEFDCHAQTADLLDFASVGLGGVQGPVTADDQPASLSAPGGDSRELLGLACAKEWPLPDATNIWGAVTFGRQQLAQ